MVDRYVALLRGINVGGNKKVDMAGLRALMTELGYADAKTLLNSGNVVFAADAKPTAAPIERAIKARFGFDVAVVLRSGKDFRRILERNPFADVADDGSRYFVLFLDRALPTGTLKELDPASYQPELLHVGKTELYTWLPAGLTGSPLMKAVERLRLPVTVTARNWNTVTKLTALSNP